MTLAGIPLDFILLALTISAVFDNVPLTALALRQGDARPGPAAQAPQSTTTLQQGGVKP